MKYFFILAFLTAYCSCQNPDDKSLQQGTPVAGNYPEAGNTQSGSFLLSTYLDIRNALIEADTLSAETSALRMIALADSLISDSTVQSGATSVDLKNLSLHARAISSPTDLTSKRRAFSQMQQPLLAFLIASRYQGRMVYVQTCPMAFNDTEEASWLSDHREIMNPYLGKKHPKYASGMLHCGELVDSLGLSVEK